MAINGATALVAVPLKSVTLLRSPSSPHSAGNSAMTIKASLLTSRKSMVKPRQSRYDQRYAFCGECASRASPGRLAKQGRESMAMSWLPDWLWGLPLLILTIVAHVLAIVWTAKVLGRFRGSGVSTASGFVAFVALGALASAAYLGLEA